MRYAGLLPFMAGFFSRLANENVELQRNILDFSYDYVIVGEWKIVAVLLGIKPNYLGNVVGAFVLDWIEYGRDGIVHLEVLLNHELMRGSIFRIIHSRNS